MGAPTNESLPAWLIAEFRHRAGATGRLRFDRFMDLALYHPEQGYYRRASPRIGYELGTDFYTASTSAPVFGALVIAAIETLLGGRRASQYHFVEVGAEPGRGILSTLNHPFASSSAFGPAETPRLSGSCIVFSNELFDVVPDPSVRIVLRHGQSFLVEFHDKQTTAIPVAPDTSEYR